jgi:hypothetical protein
VSRVIGLVRASADSDEALGELAADVRAAGVELSPDDRPIRRP